MFFIFCFRSIRKGSVKYLFIFVLSFLLFFPFFIIFGRLIEYMNFFYYNLKLISSYFPSSLVFPIFFSFLPSFFFCSLPCTLSFSYLPFLPPFISPHHLLTCASIFLFFIFFVFFSFFSHFLFHSFTLSFSAC